MVVSELLISETAAAELTRHAEESHPIETGGILIGVFAGDRPWITRAIEIPSANRSKLHYVLPAGSTIGTVDRAREEDERLGYLGEWHAHPRDAGPSPVDEATLHGLCTVVGTDTVLVLARRREDRYVLDARQGGEDGLRRLAITLAGDLSPISENGCAPRQA